MLCGMHPIETKRCSRCKKIKLTTEFRPLRRRDREELQAYCIPCAREVNSAWFAGLKLKVLRHYGQTCQCCGESHTAFLTIDHVYGNGNEHRKEVRRLGTSFYKWLIQNDFPAGFRTLCFNCNMGRQINGGTCPHTYYTEMSDAA